MFCIHLSDQFVSLRAEAATTETMIGFIRNKKQVEKEGSGRKLDRVCQAELKLSKELFPHSAWDSSCTCRSLPWPVSFC